MNFTHWVHTTKGLPNTTEGILELLHMLLYGGAALKLKDTQGVWDLMIPLYLGSTDEPINKAKLSALLIKVKSQKSAQPFIVDENDYSPLFPPTMPVISIQVEIGVPTAGIEQVACYRENLFAFVIEGAGTRTYSCLSPKEAEVVAQMLQEYVRVELEPIQEEMATKNIRYNFRTWSEQYPNSR